MDWFYDKPVKPTSTIAKLVPAVLTLLTVWCHSNTRSVTLNWHPMFKLLHPAVKIITRPYSFKIIWAIPATFDTKCYTVFARISRRFHKHLAACASEIQNHKTRLVRSIVFVTMFSFAGQCKTELRYYTWAMYYIYTQVCVYIGEWICNNNLLRVGLIHMPNFRFVIIFLKYVVTALLCVKLLTATCNCVNCYECSFLYDSFELYIFYNNFFFSSKCFCV